MKKSISKKKKLNKFLPILVLAILLFFIFLAVLAVQTTKNFTSKAESYTCPSTSTQNYDHLHVVSDYPRAGNVEQNTEINLSTRGYTEVNEKTDLVDYGGDTDPVMPPSLGTMFSHTPVIVKTYKVYKAGTKVIEERWPVNLIGIATSPGENIVAPKAGREIGGGNVLMLIYATQTQATLVHGLGEHPSDGYFIHLDNFCVDPNLLTSYNSDNAGGRTVMPVLKPGQVIGYGNGSDIRIAIRDSGDWMDPRARKDWWQQSSAISGQGSYTPVPVSSATPVPATPAPTSFTPSPTKEISQPSPSPKPTIASPKITIYEIKITATPVPTLIPTPTPTKVPVMKIVKIKWLGFKLLLENFLKLYLP